MSIELQSPHSSPKHDPGNEFEKAPPHKVTTDDFEFIRLIGQGTETEIWRARYLRNGHTYAVKKVNKAELRAHNKVKQALNEKSMLQKLRGHPGILSMYFTFQDKEYLYYCFELCEGGELREQLDVSVKLSLETTRHYAAQLMDAICYMHIKGVVHRDLTSSSIMLTTKGNIKVVSLTAAKVLTANDIPVPEELIKSSNSEDSDDSDESSDDITIYGTKVGPKHKSKRTSGDNNDSDDSDEFFVPEPLPIPRQLSWIGRAEYLPPEALDQYNMTYGCDWWAFGVILYEMLVGRPPFQGDSPYLVFQAILNQPLFFPRGFDTDARDLIEQLLQRDIKQRLGLYIDDIPQIRYHKFFEPIWAKVEILRETTGRRKNLLYHLPPPAFNVLPDFTDEEDDPLDFEFDDSYSPSQIQGDPKANYSHLQHHLQPGEIILAVGTVIKNSKWSSHFFLKRRLLILTNKPRLFYVDPHTNEVMGEIPVQDLSIGIENKNKFYLNTPDRVYLINARKPPRVYQPFVLPYKSFGTSQYIYANDGETGPQWKYIIERALNYKYLQKYRLLIDDRPDMAKSPSKSSLHKDASDASKRSSHNHNNSTSGRVSLRKNSSVGPSLDIPPAGADDAAPGGAAAADGSGDDNNDKADAVIDNDNDNDNNDDEEDDVSVKVESIRHSTSRSTSSPSQKQQEQQEQEQEQEQDQDQEQEPEQSPTSDEPNNETVNDNDKNATVIDEQNNTDDQQKDQAVADGDDATSPEN